MSTMMQLDTTKLMRRKANVSSYRTTVGAYVYHATPSIAGLLPGIPHLTSIA